MLQLPILYRIFVVNLPLGDEYRRSQSRERLFKGVLP